MGHNEVKTQLPTGVMLVGKVVINIILFFVYAVLFQVVVGLFIGVLGGIGLIPIEVNTEESFVWRILGGLSFVFALVLILSKDLGFYLSLKK